MKIALILISALLLISCDPQVDPNEEIDEGNIENDTYHSDDIGWTMEIPNGWLITTLEQTNQNTEWGSEIFKEELGIDVDYSEMNNLIAFQKDQKNNFSSTSEPWIDDSLTTWSENNAQLKTFIMQVFEGQGISVDSSLTRNVEIDGISFESYSFSIKSPDGSPLFKQTMYSTLINGYDFGANLIYSNEVDKNEMMEVWMNSTFEKK